MCIYILVIHSPVDGYLDFPSMELLWMILLQTFHTGFCMDTCFISHGQIPRSGITASRVSLCLIVKKLPNCFQSDCVLFHIPTSNKWQPQFIHSLANTCCSLFLLLLIIAILMGVKLHLTVILICISSITYDVEHLFFCLLAICVYFLVNSSYLLPPFY